MRTKRILEYSATATLLAASIVCRGETIILKNGASITGTLVEMDARQITLKHCGRVEFYARQDINAIQMDTPDKPEACPAKPKKSELPAGFAIRVRMTEYVDSRNEPKGQVFLAKLEEPIFMSGRTLVPAGGRALVKLIELSGGDENPIRTLDLIAIELGRSTWAELAEKNSGEPVTTAEVDSDQPDLAIRADRVLVRSNTSVRFVLKRSVSLEP
jgi:hypothetical protein